MISGQVRGAQSGSRPGDGSMSGLRWGSIEVGVWSGDPIGPLGIVRRGLREGGQLHPGDVEEGPVERLVGCC